MFQGTVGSFSSIHHKFKILAVHTLPVYTLNLCTHNATKLFSAFTAYRAGLVLSLVFLDCWMPLQGALHGCLVFFGIQLFLQLDLLQDDLPIFWSFLQFLLKILLYTCFKSLFLETTSWKHFGFCFFFFLFFLFACSTDEVFPKTLCTFHKTDVFFVLLPSWS